jgi:hypothetical protein
MNQNRYMLVYVAGEETYIGGGTVYVTYMGSWIPPEVIARI